MAINIEGRIIFRGKSRKCPGKTLLGKRKNIKTVRLPKYEITHLVYQWKEDKENGRQGLETIIEENGNKKTKLSILPAEKRILIIGIS